MRSGEEDGTSRWLITSGSVLSMASLETGLSFAYKIEHWHTPYVAILLLFVHPK